MAQLFPMKSAPTCQSTPKPGHVLASSSVKVAKGQDSFPAGDGALSFVIDGSNNQPSEESGAVMINISSITEKSEGCEMTAETASYCFISKIDEIGKRTQDLIESINQSRAQDQEIMSSFEKKLLSKVSEVCQQVKEQMFNSYEEHGHGMESRLQELSDVLERSSQLSSELQNVSQTLMAINTGLLDTRAMTEEGSC